jgi:drug/metabolite transporter (DMT)-like permease
MTAPPTSGRDNLRACVLMAVGMAFFAFEDYFLRTAARGLPPGQVLALMGVAGGAVLWALAARRGERIVSAQFRHPAVVVRNLGEGVGSLVYILALASLPLSLNAALLQTAPLALTAGGALILGEVVGWRRWAAVVVGFAGAMLIVRPGSADYQPAAILTLMTVLLLTGRDLATRRVPATVGTAQLTVWAYGAIGSAGFVLMAFDGRPVAMPGPEIWDDLAGALASGLLGYYAITAATRLGEASVVAPFRYTRLIFSFLLAVVVLGERPDALTLIGVAVIVGSGLYAFARQAAHARATRGPASRRGGVETPEPADPRWP